MFKKIDRLVIKAFIGPFIATFFITVLVLVMQFFWLYIDDFVGKGLGTNVIFEFIWYQSAALVPLAVKHSVALLSMDEKHARNCDGIEVTTRADYDHARKLLGPDKIIGALCGSLARHRCIAEASVWFVKSLNETPGRSWCSAKSRQASLSSHTTSA